MAAERHEYEVVYIVHPGVDDTGVSTLNDRFAQVVLNQDGEVSDTELWGRRNLAYPIRNQFEGVYVLHRFAMQPQGMDELERVLRFTEDILRYLIIRTDQ